MGTSIHGKGLDAMNEHAPDFFVPEVEADRAEDAYIGYARLCEVAPPSPGKRIYSITFEHNGETWTATVGKPLSGVGYTRQRHGSAPTHVARKLSDPAVVLAIFPGVSYQIVTNNWQSSLGEFANPFFAAETAKQIVYFSAKTGGNK
jgi:hypothetical protein